MAGYTLREAQLGIVGGKQQAVSKYITVVVPRNPFGPEGRKGSLIVAIEIVAKEHKDEGISNLVSKTIHQTYFDDRSLSITSSLREALRMANRTLYKHNIQLPEAKRVAVGVTCLALKGWDLFIAQVAPSHLAIISNGQVHRFPERPFAPGDPRNGSAHLCGLGNSLSTEPEFYRRLLQPNDTLLLYSSTIAPLLRPRHLETIGQADNVTESIALFAQHYEDAAITTGYAFVARLEPLPQPLPASPPTAEEKPVWSPIRVLTILWSRLTSLVGMGKGKPYTPRPEHSRLLFDERTTPGPAADHNHPNAPDPMIQMPYQPDLSLSPFPRPQPLDWKQSHDAYETAANQRRTSRPALQSPTPIVLSHVPADAPPLRPRFQRRPFSSMNSIERIIYLFQWFWYWLTSRFSSHHPRRSSLTIRKSDHHHHREKPRVQWLVLLVLILSLTSLILYGINLSHRSAEQHDMEYLDRASQELEAMFQAPSHTVALGHLEQAEQILDLVRSSPLITYSNSTLWLRYQEIRRDYEQGLAQVKQQTFLEQPVVLATHPDPNGRFSSLVVPPATATLSVSVGLSPKDYIYALDSNKSNSAIYRIPQEGGKAELFLSSQQDVRGTRIGTIHAMTWRIDNIVAVDESESARSFGYYFLHNGAWNYTRLGGSELWSLRGRLDMEEYQGNLYFWGAEFGEIIKFSSGHYGDVPQLWLSLATIEGVDVTTAIDMAIDGKIYLLVPSGQMFVFSMGQYERTILPPALIPPLASVTRFVLTGPPESGHIYLLDTLNERIIQMDKTSGALLQQVVIHPDSGLRLNQLTDLVVDTSRNRPVIFLINGRQIIRGNIPPPPHPFAPENTTPQPESPQQP